MQLGALTKKLAANIPVRRERQSVKVEELICSQEDVPGTHKSRGESEQITNVSLWCWLTFSPTISQRPASTSLHYLTSHITSYIEYVVDRILRINLFGLKLNEKLASLASFNTIMQQGLNFLAHPVYTTGVFSLGLLWRNFFLIAFWWLLFSFLGRIKFG